MTQFLSIRSGASGPALVGNAQDDVPLWDVTERKWYAGVAPGGGAVDSVFGRVGVVVAVTGDYDSDQVDNVSGVTGASVSDALDWLLANAGAVNSVFGRIGAVVAATGDYDSDQVDNASSVAGASVSDALDALNTAIAAGGFVLTSDNVPRLHKNLGAVQAEMHGVLSGVFATEAARLAYNVTADDVSQQRWFNQTDTGVTYFPITTGVSATWVSNIDSLNPSYAGSVIQFYGDGSDLDLLIGNVDVTLSTEKFYNNISWSVGATGRLLIPATASAVFPVVARTIDTTNMPVGGIQSNGISGSNSVGSGGGAAGGTRTLVDGTMLGAGTAGAIGGTSTTTVGNPGSVGGALPFGNGGSGGASGAGGAGSSGAGGAARAGGAATLRRRLRSAVLPANLVAGVAGATGSFRQIQGGCSGGSGAGGGGDGVASSGGGGSGGGGPVLGLYAQTWIFAASTPASAIQCKGGNGGGPTPGAGSGNKGGASGAGGAGGGYIYALGDYFIGVGLAANTFDVSGGNGGTAGGGAGTGVDGGGGVGGSGGCIDIVQRGVGLIAGIAGAAGGAPSGVTGGTGAVTRVGV